ncbi:MAG: tRNA (adenosine(37)-N6)-threonylcarbamoyltransferase complex ATPase subunit type 1 TsaE [Acidiferrobacteraceae bacterium]
MTRSFTIRSLSELDTLATMVASVLDAPLRVYLSGHIGAGKTTFIAHIIKARGYGGVVKSPTFTFIESYPLSPLTVYHMDLYRLKQPGELEFLGARDYLEGQGLCFVEWPERGGRELPPPDVDVAMNAVDDIRVIEMSSASDRGEEVLRKLELLIRERPA